MDQAAIGESASASQELSSFGVVLNHYATADAPHLRASTIFAATLSLRDPSVAEVIVVDGSPEPDAKLRTTIEDVGGVYVHEGRRLSFAEGYNIGAQRTLSPWIVLSASDVYPALDFYPQVSAAIANHGEDIGCIIPRLTKSDFPLQESRSAPSKVLSVPLMTLNINVFRRELFFRIGGVPECYSGAYNDVELSLKLRALGFKILMVPSVCSHFGSLTLESGSTNYKYLDDRDVFGARNPGMIHNGKFWDLNLSATFPGKLGSLLRAVYRVRPRRKRRDLARDLLRAAPLFMREAGGLP